ncbi:HAD family hydrolase [Candidatus Woesearchaeota archaeon]|nr:HAD family hydrolase [Candidatus Woesearchaeota archaeon]
MIKAIIFDYDGVLVDSVTVGLEAYRKIAGFLNKNGINVNQMNTLEEFRRAQRKGYSSLLKDWGITDTEIIEHTKKIYRDNNNELKENIHLIPGIKDVLEELSKKCTLVIASGTYKELILERINHLGICHYFKLIIGNDDVANNKPAPDIVNLALEKLNMKPEEAVYVGDMAYDIIAGKAARVKTIAISTDFSWNTKEQLEEQDPDIIINKHEELLDVIK